MKLDIGVMRPELAKLAREVMALPGAPVPPFGRGYRLDSARALSDDGTFWQVHKVTCPECNGTGTDAAAAPVVDRWRRLFDCPGCTRGEVDILLLHLGHPATAGALLARFEDIRVTVASRPLGSLVRVVYLILEDGGSRHHSFHGDCLGECLGKLAIKLGGFPT